MTALLALPWLFLHQWGTSHFQVRLAKFHGNDRHRSSSGGMGSACSLEAAQAWPGYGTCSSQDLCRNGVEHYAARPLIGSEARRHAATPGVQPMGLPRRCERGLDGVLLEPLSQADGAAPVVAMQLPLVAMARPARTAEAISYAGRAAEHHHMNINLVRLRLHRSPCVRLM